MGRILGIVALLVVVAVAVPIWYVDSLAKPALEDGATETFGVPTEVGSVSLGLGTFMEDTVEVPGFVLADAFLSLEKTPGGSNYQAIRAHMQKGGPPPDPDAEPGKTFVIRDLRIRNVDAKLRLAGPGGAAGRSLDLQIPESRLRDVGSQTEGGGVASQVGATVMTAVLQAVVRGGGGVAGFLTGDLRPQVGRVGEVPLQVVGEVSRIAGVGRTAGETPEEATGGALEGAGELGEQAGDALRKGIGGLLGGEKQKA